MKCNNRFHGGLLLRSHQCKSLRKLCLLIRHSTCRITNFYKRLNFDDANGRRTDEIAAKKAGLGNKETYRQAKKVLETGTPELVNALDENRIKPSVAASLTVLPPADQILLASAGKERKAQQAIHIAAS
jgi:hypothetical protein